MKVKSDVNVPGICCCNRCRWLNYDRFIEHYYCEVTNNVLKVENGKAIKCRKCLISLMYVLTTPRR